MALYKVDETTADLTKVAGGTLYADNPIGSILPYGGAIAPSGWFICQGQAISRTTYAELFAVIGTTFGSGNGSTTFNLPDLRNKAVMGAGTTGVLGASQSAQLPNITGKIDNKSGTFGIMGFSSGTNSFSGALIGSEAKGAVYTGQQNTSACKVVTFDASHSGASTDKNGNNVYKNNGETRPANVRCNFIIKAKHTPVPVDFESAVDEAVEEAMADIGTVITNVASVHPTTQGSNFNICTLTITAGTWLLVGQSGINYSGNGYYNFGIICNGISQTNRASEYNGGGVSLVFPITVTESKTVTAYGHGTSNLVSDSSHTQSATLWAIRIK